MRKSVYTPILLCFSVSTLLSGARAGEAINRGKGEVYKPLVMPLTSGAVAMDERLFALGWNRMGRTN